MANLFPTGFPSTFDVAGYSETPTMNVVETSPEAGARIVRKRFSASPLRVKGSMVLDNTQRVTLLTFFSNQQALRWQWTNDINGGIRYFDFAEPPRITPLSGIYFKVELSLYQYLTEFGGG